VRNSICVLKGVTGGRIINSMLYLDLNQVFFYVGKVSQMEYMNFRVLFFHSVLKSCVFNLIN